MDNNQTRSMEAVHNFTNELFSLYDFKVPISKAKMAAITKSAMKAIKFYKHVVQNVEKFILKCKPEYKIPGLYVIDSIVRQSRHQFGTEKDVFAPRFARNMEETFAHLFRCSQEDKSKIIRVLNLWQKNNVFAPEVIQPLFDLANPDHPVHLNFMQQQQQQQQQQNDNSQMNNGGMNIVRESPHAGGLKDDQNSEMLNASNLQKFQYQQLMMQQQQQQSVEAAAAGANHESIKFNKQLLEFDYGSEGDEDKTDGMQMQYQAAMSSSAMPLPYQFSKVLEDPNIIKQLQNIKNIDVQRYLNEIPSSIGNTSNPMMDMNAQPLLNSGLTLANINNLRGPQTINLIDNNKDQDVEFVGDNLPEVIPVSSRSPTPKHSSSKRRRSRSYSRERYGRRRRSRSTRSRSPRNRRRSRDRPRDKEREKQREIEKERRRKGLPDIKKDHLSVCSTTLWVGHLSKLVQQEELSDTFGKYGDIISIDMIPPRGCAYIVMNRRQDAHKAMQQLKNHKMQNRTITISWAAGKGVKGKEWKDYFDQTLGVTYIPSSKLAHDTDFVALEEGGMYDEDTIPAWVKEKMKQPTQQVPKDGLIMPQFFGLPDVSAIDTSQPPPNAQAMMPAFPLGARLLMPNVLPLGVPPPNMLGMVFPQHPAATASNEKTMMTPHGLISFPLANSQQTIASHTGDDHMDIEMEDEHHSVNASLVSKDSIAAAANAILQQAFYNQPPPQLGMASLLMQQQQQQQSIGDLQNDDFNRGGNRNNRSESREKDRNDFRSGRGSQRAERRSGQDSYNSRSNNRWGNNNNDTNNRDNRGRSRDDFSSSRDDYDYDRRQGGFSNRGNQQTRGSRGTFQQSRVGNFGNRAGREGRDGNGRGGYNHFNDRQGGFRDDRDSRVSRGGRNWNRDDSSEPERRQNFRGGENRNQQSSRWGNNQRQGQDEEWSDKVDDENDNETNQNDSSNQFTEENQDDQQKSSDRNYESNEDLSVVEKSQNNEDDPPPGTDDYDQQNNNSVEESEIANDPPPMDSFNDDAKSNDNSNNDVFSNLINESKSAVVENAGNTTPLCDENEARE